MAKLIQPQQTHSKTIKLFLSCVFLTTSLSSAQKWQGPSQSVPEIAIGKPDLYDKIWTCAGPCCNAESYWNQAYDVQEVEEIQ